MIQWQGAHIQSSRFIHSNINHTNTSVQVLKCGKTFEVHTTLGKELNIHYNEALQFQTKQTKIII